MLGLFRRHPRLPADKRPDLAREERVLAWAPIDEQRVAVATNLGLWLADAPRLGWHEIHKATWSGRELAVTPAEVVESRDGYAVVADGPVRTYLLLEPGELPHQVRARVTRSVAFTAHHALAPTGLGVRVVARRVPGVDGLDWVVRYDPGVPPDADAVLARTDELVAQARADAAPAG
jgi:hypothetical protein